MGQEFPVPVGAPPRIGEKFPPLTGAGIEINLRVGMRKGWGQFSPRPRFFALRDISIPIPAFPSRIEEKFSSLLLFIRF